jgi:hypothetical protein
MKFFRGLFVFIVARFSIEVHSYRVEGNPPVSPFAKGGNEFLDPRLHGDDAWIPASAGMTKEGRCLSSF